MARDTHATTPTVTFTARVHIVDEINPCVIVSKPRATALQPGWRRHMPVLVRINAGPGVPWRTNLMPRGDGTFLLYPHGPMRKASRTGVNDQVTIELDFDADYVTDPPHVTPEWFQASLDARPAALANWQALSPSRRKEVARYLAALKSPAAKERNLQRVMKALEGEATRFVGRDWVEGR
jgi:hypothetical protein